MRRACPRGRTAGIARPDAWGISDGTHALSRCASEAGWNALKPIAWNGAEHAHHRRMLRARLPRL
eukprot:66067-Alexandrium_andersonii.AAC.1